LKLAAVFKHLRVGYTKRNSVDTSNEELLYHYLYAVFPSLKEEHFSLSFSTTSNEVVLQNEDDISVIATDPSVMLSYVSNRFLKCKLDGSATGIDRVWFTTTDDQITVYGAQIRIGIDDVHMTAGSLAVQSNYIEAMNCDDNSIAGLIIQSEIGFAKILPFFGSHFNQSIHVETLYLFTNKYAEMAFGEYISEVQADRQKRSSVRVSFDTRHVVSSSRQITDNPLVLFVSFEVDLFQDTGWLEDVIPDRNLF
jgi:hypothetical protein